jgi:DNA-binding LacI/PurR family transcriptional regulator
VLKLIPSHKELTAIFAATDEIAVGALVALWQLGIRIPEDMSVVGVDDISLASTIPHRLRRFTSPSTRFRVQRWI